MRSEYELTPLELYYLDSIANKLAKLAKDRGWDDDLPEKGTKLDKLYRGTDISLMHSELSEALEGIRKDKKDDHIPTYSAETVELADAFIRILHYAHKHSLPFSEALAAKHKYNIDREDHSREHRAKEGGKVF